MTNNRIVLRATLDINERKMFPKHSQPLPLVEKLASPAPKPIPLVEPLLPCLAAYFDKANVTRFQGNQHTKGSRNVTSHLKNFLTELL